MANPVVAIEEGRVRGKTEQDYQGGSFYSFLGIPYAEAPVGDLRFKSPVPAASWEGVRDATKEGPECPARHMFFAYFIGSEDNCLNLNVHTRELPLNDGATTTKPKPVMVWIHGGAFFYGSNKRELFAPDHLMTEDIVLVTINYRLGVFGFLSLEDESLGVPGNAGLKDMVLALKWVQRNIKQFNGDPNNVTIFGESAGAASVHLLYLSPLSKGLFHKAIAQSGSALSCWATGESNNGRILAKYLGCKESEDEKKIFEYLKNVSPQKIVKAQHKAPDNFYANLIRPYGPVVEKPSSEAFLSEEPIEILKKGTFNKVPMIMGYTSKEGIFFEIVRKLQPDADITTDFEREIHHDLKVPKGAEKSKEIANKIAKFYYGEEQPSEKNIDKLYLLKTDTQFVHGVHRSVELQKINSDLPIYMYRMSLETSLNYYKRVCMVKSVHALFFLYYLSYKSGMTKNLFLKLSKSMPNGIKPTGVCHADDLGYLFPSFLSQKLEPGSPEDISVRKFVKLWTNFAKTGNPTPEKSDLLNNIEWTPVSREENTFLDIGKELKLGTNPDNDRMQFWDSIYS